MRLLDTDVLVDVLRGYPPALDWLGSLEEAPALPGLVVMEVLGGCLNKQEMNKIQRYLGLFNVHWPTDSDCNRALGDFARSHLSHNLGVLDALIGETAVGLGATLCTFNDKHFMQIRRLTVEQPYQKTTAVLNGTDFDA